LGGIIMVSISIKNSKPFSRIKKQGNFILKKHAENYVNTYNHLSGILTKKAVSKIDTAFLK